jgi:hypothetical protein
MSKKTMTKEAEAALRKLKLSNKEDDDDEEEEQDEEDDDDNDIVEYAPKSILRRVTGLKKSKYFKCSFLEYCAYYELRNRFPQEEVETIHDSYKEERIALEKKYAELRAPLIVKRNDVIKGAVDFDESVFEGAHEGGRI